MRYKILGKSGLRVSELALGTMTFGTDWGWGADKETSQKIFETYADAGGNFIDTAVNYTNGTAETYVGDFTAADRAHFVIATKYTLSTRRGDPNASGNHRKNMVQSLEASLKRLKTDYLDLYWLHAWDFTTPVEEVMRALDDMVRAGKVLHVGVSDTPAWIVSQANTLADLRGWSRFVALQIRYSLADRAAERDLLPMARALDLAVTPWSVLGAGTLTGKYNQKETAQGRAANWNEIPARNLKVAETVTAVAKEANCTPAQVALTWVRRQTGVIIPILGATKVAQLQDNLNSLHVTLSAAQLDKLDEANKIELGFPHDFLASDEIRNIVFSGKFDEIDNHHFHAH
jgi:aryl-alcohol dehydrogenase-like predicted oxidoreductase